MIFCAYLLVLSGAVFIYLSHPQQRLLSQSKPSIWRIAGALSILIGGGFCCVLAGIAAGSFCALTTLMLSWIALPYLAWRRKAKDTTRVGATC